MNDQTISAEDFMKGAPVDPAPSSGAPLIDPATGQERAPIGTPPTEAEAAAMRDFAAKAKSPKELEDFVLNLRPDHSLGLAPGNAKKILNFRNRYGAVSHDVTWDGNTTTAPETWGEWFNHRGTDFVHTAAGLLEGLLSPFQQIENLGTVAAGGDPANAKYDLQHGVDAVLPQPDPSDASGVNARTAGRGAGAGIVMGPGVGRLLSMSDNAVAQGVGKVLSEIPGSQVVGGATGEVAAQKTKEAGGGPLAQTLAALVAGGGTMAAGSRLENAAAHAVGRAEAPVEETPAAAPATADATPPANELDHAAGKLVEAAHAIDPDPMETATQSLVQAARELDPNVEVPAKIEAGAKPDEAAPIDHEDVVRRLTDALSLAGAKNVKQLNLYKQARSERLQNVLDAQNSTSGESGFRAELSQLKGELPKIDFEGVRDQFTQPEIDTLFDSIKNDGRLSTFDKINARTGLAKLLDGSVPTASELSLLGKTFPADFLKAAMKHVATGDKIKNVLGNVINIPRSLMASIDLSAPFTQGAFMVGRKEFWNAWVPMFKAFGSERAYQGILDDIQSRPSYPLMEETGLAIRNSGSLTDREEQFMSQWAEHMPGSNILSKGYNATIGRGVHASERAYTGFLYKVRADTFDTILRLSRDAGVDFDMEPKALTDIASFVNNATGRGSLGALSKDGPILNGLFFSPRLIASRVTMLNPYYYYQLSPVVRKEAVKSLLTFGALASTVLGLAKMGGADVEADPTSSDFGKIKIGDTRYDVTGKFGSYITFGARMLYNEKKTLTGKEHEFGKGYKPETRWSAFNNFMRSKFSPVASFVADWADGKNVVGKPFQTGIDTSGSTGNTIESASNNSIIQRFVPLFLQDTYDVIKENGFAKGVPMSVPGLFGVGTQTFDPNVSKKDFAAAPEAPASAAPASAAPASAAPASAAKAAPAPELSAEDFLKGTPVDAPAPKPKAAPVPAHSTFENSVASQVLEGQLGLRITDNGIRSTNDQTRYHSTTKGAAAPGHSRHEVGNAVDVGVPSGVSPSEIASAMGAAGFKGVKVITRKHGTGPHWHIQWDGVE